MLLWITRPAIASKAILVVFVVLCLVFAIELIGIPRSVGTPLILLYDVIPMPFFLAAIWSVRRAVILIGGGGALELLLSALLWRVGASLFLGGLALVFAAPLLVRLFNGSGSYAHYDSSAITVGVVGLALMIVARVVTEAGAMRAELDEIL
ncbi:MAG: hypothetical protein K2W86_03845 [Sphingomonas sp.]|uniref:hypothetical protein n=1 Tax=Sphingomonas sp. TaxID=28214 RepID=UPI0035A95B7C|nr:hypothetical protein [Sphingomonas sp.]